MEEKKQVSLPENAQRELKPGEEYKPLLDSRQEYAEATPYSVSVGILMVILLIDNFLKQYDNKRKREWMQKHLNDMDVEEEQEKEENN